MKSTINKVSICIPSYKRINELKRCLDSIDYVGNKEIEIIVSEDCSNNRELIRSVVMDFSSRTKYKIIFHENEKNLGYDRNIAKLVELATGEYVILISDDDRFIQDGLNKIIAEIQDERYACLYSPFIIANNKTLQRSYSKSFVIEKGELSAGKLAYDSILFSGLIFNKRVIAGQSAEDFVGLNYFQVYLFLYCIVFHDCKYFNIPLIECIGDGENGFGQNDFQVNEFLSDRNSVFSNLEFHNGLIKVIKMFDRRYNTNIIKLFQEEYSLRAYTGLLAAAALGRKTLKDYYSKLNELDIKLSRITKVYYYMLKVLGVSVNRCLIKILKGLLHVYRANQVR